MGLAEVKDAIALKAFGRTRTEALEQGICVQCGKKAESFRDELSSKEYEISALCQTCQDAFFN